MCDLETVELHEIPIKVRRYVTEISYWGAGEKKQVFLQLFNISTFIGVDLSIVEELFSLLF